jgi:hypothetical protein
LKFDLSTASPYIVPIVFGFSGSVLLISYYILSIKKRNEKENWRFFPRLPSDKIFFSFIIIQIVPVV